MTTKRVKAPANSAVANKRQWLKMTQNGGKGEGATKNMLIVCSSCNTCGKPNKTVWIQQCMLNRWVTRACLSVCFYCKVLMSYGNVLQVTGLGCEKEFWPKVFVLTEGTHRKWLSLEERSCIDGVSHKVEQHIEQAVRLKFWLLFLSFVCFTISSAFSFG